MASQRQAIHEHLITFTHMGVSYQIVILHKIFTNFAKIFKAFEIFHFVMAETSMCGKKRTMSPPPRFAAGENEEGESFSGRRCP